MIYGDVERGILVSRNIVKTQFVGTTESSNSIQGMRRHGITGHPKVEAICRMVVRSKPRSRNSSNAAFRMRVLVSFELLFCSCLCLSMDVAR